MPKMVLIQHHLNLMDQMVYNNVYKIMYQQLNVLIIQYLLDLMEIYEIIHILQHIDLMLYH